SVRGPYGGRRAGIADHDVPARLADDGANVCEAAGYAVLPRGMEADREFLQSLAVPLDEAACGGGVVGPLKRRDVAVRPTSLCRHVHGAVRAGQPAQGAERRDLLFPFPEGPLARAPMLPVPYRQILILAFIGDHRPDRVSTPGPIHVPVLIRTDEAVGEQTS